MLTSSSFIIDQGAFVFMIVVRTIFEVWKAWDIVFLVNDENILTHSEAFTIVTDHI